ncbi:ribonuclease P protein component [Flavobacterium covae]|uniref:Ribonuclease P protein component n=2 Tax=Flavobacterium TaxID=237 RepID=A0AA94JP16_9FLAO|nr:MULTISPECIES: ribonuclease P protein component [Flavobacterium]AND63797.1 ribonuclease P protein component [Flavobacterium covae]MCH4829961.1 ribonuclease P protein component [Flavobacterium columnare]MCJ1807224.1 ribonuclease P protein component [Flavobacterium covae]OWP81663.1 ribonuclease P protein component [Flavobacterium covae]OWP88139.1 ribonuclease P protein component [Flavobacterium covae]
MKQNYPNYEKLKSRTLIDHLFANGKSVSKYPIRLVFVEVPELKNTSTNIQIGVSVSKKYFKKAVDRNYYKRVLREVYRLNKAEFITIVSEKKYIMMLMYQTKDRLDFHEISDKIKSLLIKFNEQLNKQEFK